MSGDDEQPRRSRVPDLLRYQERYETSSTQQQRSKGGKVTVNEIRPNVVKRADVGAELVCLRLAVAQMTALEWRCYIGIKEGVLFRADGTWFVVPPPAKAATPEQVAAHYGVAASTVERYERRARDLVYLLRDRAGLTAAVPNVPVWPAVMSDERLLRYLYGRGE